jgi:hypothetical protein
MLFAMPAPPKLIPPSCLRDPRHNDHRGNRQIFVVELKSSPQRRTAYS